MADLAVSVSIQKGGFSLTVDDSIALQGITGVFGASGSGKTTLLRIISGLERGALGKIIFGDSVWQDETSYMPTHDRQIGYVFQEGRLFPHLNVGENLKFAVAHTKSRGAVNLSDVVDVLDLETLLERNPVSLSGGEQQRVAIGRALLTSPQILLMDEPLSSLDVGRKREIIRYIEQLPGAFNLPILYVTHSLDEVTRLANRLLLLDNGRVVGHGDLGDILERVDLWSTTGRLEAGSVLEARVQHHANGMTRVAFDDQTLQIPEIDAEIGTNVRLRIHARDVVIATEHPRHLSIRNILPAHIARIDLDASVYAELLLEIGSRHLRARITREALRELGLEQGRSCYALIKSVAFEDHLFS